MKKNLPGMLCVLFNRTHRQRHNWITRKTQGILISSALIVLSVWSLIFNCICRSDCISNTRPMLRDKSYIYRKESLTQINQMFRVMRSLKKYEHEISPQVHNMSNNGIKAPSDKQRDSKRKTNEIRIKCPGTGLKDSERKIRKKRFPDSERLQKVNDTNTGQHPDQRTLVSMTGLPEEDVKLQNITEKPVRRLPQAIIIGVKKCGTRALLEYLRLHPDIRAPGPEPHFFDRHYHLGLDWYRQRMPPTIEGQITIEKTPRYFVMPEVPARISGMSKDILLIIVVRDPVTRAISDYTQGSSKDPNVTETFVEKAFHNNGSGGVHKNWSALRTGMYVKHVNHWLNYFPLSRMHFVSGENLISNPAQEVQKVTDFLGLKRVISEKHFYFNETKGFPCLKKREGTSETKCFDRSKGRPHPHVDESYLQTLKQFFKPYNEEFYQLVEKDFGWS